MQELSRSAISGLGVDDWSNTGVLGASSLVGICAIPLLIRDHRRVFAFSRHTERRKTEAGVTWVALPSPSADTHDTFRIRAWLSLMPIWILPQYFSMIEASGACRVVALSSTSILVKGDSSNQGLRDIASRLDEGEQALRAWAESRGIEWVILRPTLIYGRGRDKNLTEIVRFVRRWGFFPLLGQGDGLRQPVHADDIAAACLSALTLPVAANRIYNLSGGEMLPYQEMVCRVFATVGKLPHLVTIPRWLFRLAVTALRLLPRYRHWTVEMAERMNRDLVFDHAEAARDLGFSPRPFVLSPEDLPA
jgi:hypothetical protein